MEARGLPPEELTVDLAAHCLLALLSWDGRSWLLLLKDSMCTLKSPLL